MNNENNISIKIKENNNEIKENEDNMIVNSVNTISENLSMSVDSDLDELSKFNNDWDGEHFTDNESRVNDTVDDPKKYIQDFRIIKENMSSVIPTLYSTMTFIRYKSSILRFSYKFSSILIILFSSIITFVEALRANIETSAYQNLVITVTTLTLSFIIALTASIVKFFNLQDKIEKLNILNNMLETPYLEASKLLEKIKIRSERDINKNMVRSLRASWEKIIDQYAKPHIDVHNILHPNKVTQYMQKYNTQKKQIDDINLYNDNMRSIRNIEQYIVGLQKEILTNLNNEESEGVHYTLQRLGQLNDTLGNLNNHLAMFKSTMSKIYTRDRLRNYKTEIQNIEWWRFKNLKELICCVSDEDEQIKSNNNSMYNNESIKINDINRY
tara:strand:- start:251 stop:1405 length:1155 start_codon:yes stop_codon:yes gene_type:complete